MRLKTRTWMVLGLVLFVVSALWWWQSSHQQRAGDAAASKGFQLNITNGIASQAARPATPSSPFKVIATNLPNTLAGLSVSNIFAYRLSNTAEPFAKLLRNDRAVLLRNALIDTTRPRGPEIPEHLRAKGDPGSYIVQARWPITQAFHDSVTAAGAEIVSYIPNNAYLIRGSAAVAARLNGLPDTQKVLAFEPYYKLDSRLLPIAVEKQLSPYPLLNIVAFPGTTKSAIQALEQQNVEVQGRPQSTPYGDVLVAKVPANGLADVAGLAQVQLVGVHFEKRVANDLTRVLVRISTNTIVPPPQSHYHPTNHLTGNGITVGVNDTGVDAAHPDLSGRVYATNPAVLFDPDGHGTHVIGILEGNGSQSLSVGSADGTNSNARGSTNGAYFTGMAPQARAFVQFLEQPDDELQQNTALNDALISNNSWGFPGDNDYDIFAASYDAAVRDSLPGVTGEQQVMYVFACGNEGGGGDNGLNGIPGSVISPASAKNVISVGASDLPRFITNEVHRACRDVTNTIGTNTVVSRICETNRPWYGMTDTNNQVSPYSSRGNVGIGIEGLFGRFKPDVVAPGSMLVSTRSSQYQEPDGSTNTFVFRYNSLTIGYPETNLYALTIPPEAIKLSILTLANGQSPTNLTLWIDAAMDQVPPGPGVTNQLDLLPPTLRAGTCYFTIANTNHPQTVSYDLVLLLTVTNDVGDYYTVLKALNEPLKPYYRYEAGTSMAAPVVSGMLADIQQYLTNQFSIRPSPALLKALLINGARSLSANYNLQVNAPVNHQGWGLVNISNSVPSGLAPSGTNGPMRFFDQTLTESLATGGTETYQVTVPDEAKSYPLRITLVWTDPPGNPVTTIKLVNDLNLSVIGSSTNEDVIFDANNVATTNSTTFDLIWPGNNFPPGSDFTDPIITASNGVPVVDAPQQIEAVRDFVNNVENVYIRPPLSDTYTVVVKGHRVNVGAVNSHSNSLAQDYALVISSGNVAPSNNVNLAVTGPVFTNDITPRIAALARASNATSAGLLNQRVGANNPLIVSTNGASNQWAFFTYTNVTTPNFTNVAIITFYAQELSLPRFREADIDLYVTHDNDGSGSNLFALDDAAIAIANKSLTRGGTELVLFTNAQPDEVFYIGVKSEDQQAANFSIFAVSSDKPFSSRDSSNNIVAQAVPLPTPIPDGTPDQPGGTNLFALVFDPDVTVQRVYVTNRIYHEEAGDLIGIISHQDPIDQSDASVTLNNHRTWNGVDEEIYDDSDQGDLDSYIPTPIPTDGPGSLRDFVGQQAFGVWNYSISDNALFHTGEVQELTLVIQPASTNQGDAVNLLARVQPMKWVYAGFRVPADATNVQICAIETDGPIDLYMRRGAFPTLTQYDKLTNTVPPGACMDYGLGDTPPLSPGRYFVGAYNPSAVPVHVHIIVTIQRGLVSDRTITTTDNNLTSILDDATTNSMMFITNRGLLTSIEVDVRLNHPRIADLALHLISPAGTRLLLAENRGRDTTNGYGVSSNVVVTNFIERVLDNGFEETLGGDYYSPAIVSGWRIDSGDVDFTYAYGPASSGTNMMDLNGNGAGSISTNVATVPNKTYLLRFTYSKNSNYGGNPGFVPTGQVQLNGQTVLNISYATLVNYGNLYWSNGAVLFRATGAVTRVGFVSTIAGNGGLLLDTIRMDQVEVTTNSFLYATFTDDSSKAVWPIKFAPPPFGDTNFISTNKFINGFEGTNGGNFANKLIFTNANLFTNGQSFDGWWVTTNSVYVQTNTALAYSDTNLLYLRTGSVARVLSNTVQGKEYILQFATRTMRRAIYSTGVDVDDIPLQLGEQDSHYIISTNSTAPAVSKAFSYVLLTNEMAAAWFNKTNGNSRWIGLTNIPGTNVLIAGSNIFGYLTTFDMTSYQTNTASLTGLIAADDRIVRVRLNGKDANFVGVPLGNSAGFTSFTITNTPAAPFLQRGNKLEFIVTNTTTSPHGFRAEFPLPSLIANLQTNKDGSFVSPPLHYSIAQVRLAGSYTNYFTALSDEWRVQYITFVAHSNNVLLQFTGITPGVWLDDIQIRETGRKYYLPEEPFTPLIGQDTYGPWKLELWDNRLGAALGDTNLLSWRLNINYARTNPPFVRLTNNLAYTGTIGTNTFRYFAFDIPCDAGEVTNALVSLSIPRALDLIFNQDTFPLTGALGDFPLLLNVTTGTNYLDVGAAPLLRGGRFYLAVRNTNALPVDFLLNIGMTTPCAPTPFIITSGFTPDGFILVWQSNPGDQFSVQYASDPAGPWTEIPQTITSDSADFSFTDNGAFTGGFSPQRFYRLRRH